MTWLYVTAAATAIFAVAGWLISKEAALWLKGLMILLVVVVLVAQIIIVRAEIRGKEVSRYVGVLEGKPVTILSVKQQAYPKLQLGNSKAILVWQGPQGEPMFRIFEDNDITIWIYDGALKVSTKIRNDRGELISELVGNEWKTAIPPKIWDRNYSKNALEVIDAGGKVVLQVVLREDVVQFAAKMYSSNGEGIAFGSTEDPKFGVVGVMQRSPAGQPLELVIDPIFKYPSELHLGELR